jgi:Kelch motif protein
MIVWGGYPPYLNTGGKYDPLTDSWVATTTSGSPEARSGHTAVWTGTEMIVWGGYNDPNYLNSGGRYNPVTNSWVATTTTNSPVERSGLTAIWTGTEMIVWGGYNRHNGGFLNTGGRYCLNADGWSETTTTNAPSRRTSPTSVWTGTEMMVWGGYDGLALLNTGGRYCDASTGRCRLTPAPRPTPPPHLTPPPPPQSPRPTPWPRPTQPSHITPPPTPSSPRPTPWPRP